MGDFSILPMLIFIATIFLIFKHPLVRIPFTSKYFQIDYGLAPIMGAIILLATSSIDPASVERAIIGGPNLKPYSILTLIISLSYICVSLDYTGFFEYISLHLVRASGNSGRKLFVYFFLLTAFLTLFTDNDIVILTMTLIILYVCKNARLDPLPFLFAQFFTVNIFGMALYIGNPTNIVAADAYGLSFLEFARWMFLPSIFAGFTCFLLLWFIFRRGISRKLKPYKIDPHLALKNKRGAAFGSIVLACALICMSMIKGVPIWMIALSFAIVMFLFDLVSYRSRVSTILSRMPWKIVPFLLGLFIIVEGLASAGWTDLFASQLSKIFSMGLTTAVFCTCFMSTLLAGVMNNHPMVIFFVKTFQSGHFSMGQSLKLGSTLALIAGSNFGANFTLIGSLAGLMWAKILYDKGHPISFLEFSKYGLFIMPLVIAVTCTILIGELMIGI